VNNAALPQNLVGVDLSRRYSRPSVAPTLRVGPPKRFTVAPPLTKPPHTPAGVVERGRDRFSDQAVTRPAEDRRLKMRKYAVGQVVVLEVAGLLGDVVEDLDPAIKLALAEGPRGVVCDLSVVLEGAEAGVVDVLASAGRHARDWPGIPVAVACPDPQLRATLAARPLGRHLIVTESILEALSAVLWTRPPAVGWLHLEAHPSSSRAARDFVTTTLLDWGMGSVISSASLVVSELVTNSTVHAGTEIDLSVASDRQALRLTVRDHSPGVLPTADGGKLVWAVLEVPPPISMTSKPPSDSAAATQEL
jgi:hypothetical protein